MHKLVYTSYIFAPLNQKSRMRIQIMPSTERGKRTDKASLKRTQKRMVREIAFKHNFNDPLLAETVWTQTTTQAVYEGLKVSFGFVNTALIEANGTVCTDSRGQGAFQK